MHDLENYGFTIGANKFLPIWIEIIIDHLGTPENIKLLQHDETL
jgi:hypothetical protein